MSHLTASYPPAITDFYGSGTLCIYKTGPAWPISEWRGLIRAARPIHNHPIAPIWLETARSIVALLDSLQVDWNTVDPLAYANSSQGWSICDFVITIGVRPRSLDYDAAVAAAKAVDGILQAAGFPEIEVAFIESIYRHQARLASKFMGFNPVFDLEADIPALRKPFTPTLGLSIAPDRAAHYEGTGGLFFRLSTDESDKRLALLSCAHVIHPPALFPNNTYTRADEHRGREDILLLGSRSFEDSIEVIMKFMGDQEWKIADWESSLRELPEPEEGEPAAAARRREELAVRIHLAQVKMKEADELHSYVTKNCATSPSRILGSVLHCAKIEVGDDKFIRDWGFIQIDNDKLPVKSKDFPGNKLYVGGNKTPIDWQDYMFAQPHDRRDFHILYNSLLQLQDYVRESEFRDPQNYDIHGVKTLLAVKNGRTTGTTYGRVNGLESVIRGHSEFGIHEETLAFLVCGYDTEKYRVARFSDYGDSGSVVAGRDGRIIGLLTGGAGPNEDRLERSYITPYYSLKKAIEKEYPDCFPLPAAAGT